MIEDLEHSASKWDDRVSANRDFSGRNRPSFLRLTETDTQTIETHAGFLGAASSCPSKMACGKTCEKVENLEVTPDYEREEVKKCGKVRPP